MVEWTSPDVLALTSFSFAQATVFMLGVYLWYFVLSLKDVEWALLARGRQFQLAHVPYLIGRYSHLLAAIGIAVATHLKNPPGISCSGLAFQRFLALTEQIALAAASGNLALRAYALWKDVRCVNYTLWCVCIAHFLYAFICIAAVSPAKDPVSGKCFVKSIFEPLVAFFIFTMVWDVTIMALTLWGMRRKDRYAESKLSAVVMLQGIGYAVVTTLTCVPMAVVFILQLNDVMNIFLIPVGCTFSVITSSAVVTSLFHIKIDDHDSEVQPPSRVSTFNNSKTPIELSTVIDRIGFGTSTTSWRSQNLDVVAEGGLSSMEEVGMEPEDSSTRPLKGGASDVELGRYGLA